MRKINPLTVFLLLISIGVIFAIQFLTPTLYGADGYLHIRMAEFLRDFGPRYNFHWARFSTFTEHFSDKDFLYHFFLIPFTFFEDIFCGAKMAAAFFASLAFLGFCYIMRRYSGRLVFPFFLAAFFLSDMFLQAISRPRPISLVILITVVAVHLFINKKYRVIFFLAMLYALSHVTSPLIIIYALIIELVRYFDEKEFFWRNVFTACLGVLAGFVVHPNFPDNLIVFYLNSVLVPLYTLKTGVLELGAEFFPLNTRDFLLSYPVVILGVISLIYVAVSRRPKAEFATKALLTLSMFFFILSFVCRRYLLHGYPIMLIALSSYFNDASTDIKNIGRKVAVFVIILFTVFAANTFKGVRYGAFVTKVINGHYESMGSWMKENIPDRELIFHANWSDSQYFIGLNPKNDYFVTLDPVYMYHPSPELYKLYRNLSFGRVEDPYVVLKNIFGSRYGYAGKSYFSGLITQIRQDKRFKILKEDNFGIIFKL